jgi:hypothetical protein
MNSFMRHLLVLLLLLVLEGECLWRRLFTMFVLFDDRVMVVGSSCLVNGGCGGGCCWGIKLSVAVEAI